jgi:hypothetical protein
VAPLRSFNINELTTVPQGARNYKAFLEGLKDAKREKDLAYLELTAGIVGTVSYLRYRNAKKAGR